jgi:hypothetical protein
VVEVMAVALQAVYYISLAPDTRPTSLPGCLKTSASRL